MAKSKLTRIVTPIGKWEYPKLDVPVRWDEATNKAVRDPNSMDSSYSVTLVLDKKDASFVIGAIEAETPDKAKNCPYETRDDGTVAIHARQKAFIEVNGKKIDLRPKLYDAAGNNITGTVNPWGGSRGRLKVDLNPYRGMGGGVSLRLIGAQVVELVEGGDSGFDPVDGGGFNVKESDDDLPVTQDDLPF
jgi:hypothetical protein